MEPLIGEITAFDSLQEFVQSNEGNLFDLTKQYYAKLGSELGFDAVKDFEIQFHDLRMPSADLVWLDADSVSTAFFFCFGSRSELLAAIFSALALEADLSVLITSFKAKNYSLKEIKTLLEETPFLKTTNSFLLIDISTEKHLVV